MSQTISEISFHGMVVDPETYVNDNQDINALFTVPDNVTVIMRGLFGYSQYTIPDVVDTVMGRSSETFTNMLKRHNSKYKFYGPLYYYGSGERCINLALHDDPNAARKYSDYSFIITSNTGKRVNNSINIITTKTDDIETINSICTDRDKMKHFNNLKDVRIANCIASQKLGTGNIHLYLKEIINMLIDNYNIDHNNNLVVYVSSCQVVDEDWNTALYIIIFKEIIDTTLRAQERGLLEFNPMDLKVEEKGVSINEIDALKKYSYDHGNFYGDMDESDGDMYIPDIRGVEFIEWYAKKFN